MIPKEIEFLTTPDGFQSLPYVLNQLKLKTIKIGSSELNHHEFLIQCALEAKTIILSTGLSTFDEVSSTEIALKKTNNKIDLYVLQCT